jgi:hypothetical protein
MIHHRVARSAALGLALAALAAPAAGAQQPQDLRSPTGDVAGGHGANYSPQAPEDPRSPYTGDVAGGHGADYSPQVVIVKERSQPRPAPADGLDWADAGIGAGTLLGLGLIGLGGALLIGHRRRTARDAPPVAGL